MAGPSTGLWPSVRTARDAEPNRAYRVVLRITVPELSQYDMSDSSEAFAARLSVAADPWPETATASAPTSATHPHATSTRPNGRRTARSAYVASRSSGLPGSHGKRR